MRRRDFITLLGGAAVASPLVARDFLDAFRQLHQRRAVLWPDGGKTHAAIAEHRRGDTMPAGGREQRVPHRLPVIVGVHVDPAGRDQEARGVDLAPSGTLPTADFHDALTCDRPGDRALSYDERCEPESSFGSDRRRRALTVLAGSPAG